MSKNKRKNAFFFFMLDWKEQKEKEGRTFPRGIRDVQADDECNTTWKNLSESDKQYYQTKAKKSNVIVKDSKKTTIGEIIKEIKEAQQREQDFICNMKESIAFTVNEAKKKGALPKLSFYMIQVNHFYHRILDDNTPTYCPAEIAIAECSLEAGVKRIYHKLITPQIETGYLATAKEYSMNSHQLPTDVEKGSFSKETMLDFDVELYKSICNFLEPGRECGSLPPLFTWFHDESRFKFPACDILNKLTTKCGAEQFLVYSIEELFLNLNNIASNDHMDDLRAHMELNKDLYDYTSSTQCEFHQITGSGGNYCSKSLVQRWMFTICSICCPLFNIEIRPGLHKPVPLRPLGVIDDLSNDLQSCRIQSATRNGVSTGAVRKYTKSSHERSQAEEDRRRYKLASEPPSFTITQHGTTDSEREASEKFASAVINRGRQAPPPQMRSAAVATAWSPPSVPENSYDDNFPSLSIGRGRRNNSSSSKSSGNYASKLR